MNPIWVFVGDEIEHDELRGCSVYSVHTAIVTLLFLEVLREKEV